MSPSRSRSVCSSRPGSLVRETMNSRMMAPKPQQIASRNDMLNTSNSRRRFMANPPTARASSRPCAATTANRPAPPAGSPSIANMMHVDRHADRQLPDGAIEVIEAVGGVDAGARGHHVAHRRQAVVEQIDVVGLRLEQLQRVERRRARLVRPCGWLARSASTGASSSVPSLTVTHCAFRARDQPRRLVAEADDLHLRAGLRSAS